MAFRQEVQAFFNVRDLLFNYGGHFEHFDIDFHRVSTTQNLWLAGGDLTREVIITANAMEAIALLAFNFHRYPDLTTHTFIAVGNLPQPCQLNWIRASYPKRKFTLVSGNDILGKLTDIKVGAGLHQKSIRLLRSGFKIQIECNNALYEFEQDGLSLNAFEKVSGLRTGIRTNKPNEFNTYLDQLKYDANQ